VPLAIGLRATATLSSLLILIKSCIYSPCNSNYYIK
jgi:hypothetical protein